MASIYAYRGQADKALAWLDLTYRVHGTDTYMIKGDPSFAGMVGDPRYQAFLRRLNLSP